MVLDGFFSYNPPEAPSPKKKNEVDYKKNPTKLFKRVEGRAWESAIERIQTNDVETKIWVVKSAFDGSVTWKRLPLHEACIRKPTSNVVKSLIQSNPNAVTRKDSDGRLPLHHACANGASVEVVELLLSAFPDGIDKEDGWKKTPLQTLMAQYFPDPHCISALKRGSNYYKMQSSSNASVAPSIPHSPSSKISRGQSPLRTSSTYDRQMIQGLEGEIGRFSNQLAMNADEKNGMHKRIRMLESEVNRLLGLENENARLKNDLAGLNKELESTKDAFQNEREESRRDLRLVEDLQRSEERLKRQVEELSNDPRQRILEDNLNDLNRELNEKDAQYVRDMQNVKHALENAERDAASARGAANKLEDECNRLKLELKQMEFEKDTASNIIHDLKDKIMDMDNMKREMALMDRENRNNEDQLRSLSQKLRAAEEEVANLREDNVAFTRLQAEFRSQGDYVKDMEDQLRRSEDEIRRIADVLKSKERIANEEEDAQDAAKKKMMKDMDELRSDLERSQRKNDDLLRDKEEVERRHQKMSISLNQARREKSEFEQRELSISLEVNKLQRSIDGKVEEMKNKWLEEQITSQRHLVRCNELEQDVKLLRDKIDDANASANDGMKEMLNLQRKLKEKELAYDNMKKKKEKLEADVLKRDAMKEEFKRKETDKQNQIKQMELLVEKMNNEFRSVQETHTVSKEENATLRDEISDLNAKLHTQKREMESSIDILQREKRLIEGEMKDLDREKKALEEKLASLSKNHEVEMTQIERNNNSFYKEKLDFISERDNLIGNQTKLESKIIILEKKINEQNEEMSFMRNTYDKEKHLLAEGKEDLQNQNKKLQDQNQNKKLQETLATLSQRDSSSRFDIGRNNSIADGDELNAKLHHAQIDIYKMETTIEQLEREKALIARENESLLEEKRDLELERKNVEGRLHTVMNKLESTKKDMANISGSNKSEPEWQSGNGLLSVNDQNADSEKIFHGDEEVMVKFEQLRRENSILRALMEEDGTNSTSSLDELEERLLMLEETKDAEISLLMQERDDLALEVQLLRDRVIELEGEVTQLKEERNRRSSAIGKLKAKRDRKKKTIEARLRDYESRSCAGSVVSMHKIRARADKDDTMSTISGITSNSTGPSSDSGEKNQLSQTAFRSRRYELGSMFPSSVSVTGLSIDASMKRIPTRVTVRSDASGTSTPSTIIEERIDDSSRSSRRSMRDGIRLDG